MLPVRQAMVRGPEPKAIHYVLFHLLKRRIHHWPCRKAAKRLSTTACDGAQAAEAYMWSNWRDFCPYAEESVPFVFRPCTGTGPVEASAGRNGPSASSAAGSEAATSLPLFGSVTREAVLRELPPKPGVEAGPAAVASETVLAAGGPIWSLHWHPHPPFFLGEPLLALQLLALSAHRVTSPFNTEGKRQQGPALIQIWEVPLAPLDDAGPCNMGADAGAAGGGRSSGHAPQDVDDQARMVLGIAHRGGTAWDVKWHPGSGASLARSGTPDMVAIRPRKQGQGPGSSNDAPNAAGTFPSQGAVCGDMAGGSTQELQLPSLGMLAVALADGTVYVYTVPEPQGLLEAVSECEPAVPWARVPAAIRSPFCGGQNGLEGGTEMAADGEDVFMMDGDGDGDMAMFDFSQPLVVDMVPLFRDDSSSTVASGPCILAWSPVEPHETLLGGCFDGTVIMWKLPNVATETTTLAPTGRPLVRMLKIMCDEEPVRAISWITIASRPSDLPLIATAGCKPGVRFWDLREPHRPLWDWKKCVPGTVRSMAWMPALRTLALALDEGGVRFGMISSSNTGRMRGSSVRDAITSWGGTRFVNLTDNTTVWHVDVVPGSGLGVCCGGDGVTWLFQVHELALSKATSSHNRMRVFACSALEWRGVAHTKMPPLPAEQDQQGRSAELAAEQVNRQANAEGPLVLSLEVNEGLLPPPPEPRFASKDKQILPVARGSFPYRHEQVLYRTAWAPIVTGPSAVTGAMDSRSGRWPLIFAQGGGAGLVRCVTLRL
eukprot:jgi/Mesvir1/23080/Mv10004-RA.1